MPMNPRGAPEVGSTAAEHQLRVMEERRNRSAGSMSSAGL